MTTKPILSVRDLSVTYPDNNGGLHALDNITFNVHPREFVCFLGPSGSGKTTFLRVLAGIVQPTSGSVSFMHNHQPRIGMVFQQANLMPWRTVMENIMLPLELEGTGQVKAQNKAREMIARALIHDPDLLLLDEPFASLDALTRERMWTELSNLWQARQKTVIMVTHSINESLFLADRVMVLTQRPGKIKLDVVVDLPRPRTDDIRYTSHFGKLAKKLRSAIE
jgi:NitT/TauT family transport system ATP-binding protein